MFKIKDKTFVYQGYNLLVSLEDAGKDIRNIDLKMRSAAMYGSQSSYPTKYTLRDIVDTTGINLTTLWIFIHNDLEILSPKMYWDCMKRIELNKKHRRSSRRKAVYFG